MARQRLDFPGSLGAKLAARLDLPDGPPRAYALFAHCFTCTKDIFAASEIAARLASGGVAVVRFDFTGLGHSDGEFASTNFSSNVDDLVAAADMMRTRFEAPQLLVGHSLGGAAVLAAAPRIPEAVAVATIGAPCNPTHVKHLFKDAEADIERDGQAEVVLAGRTFSIQKQFLDDLAQLDQPATIANLRKALLVLHSPVDELVGIDNARHLFQTAKHPKSFVSLDGAKHLLPDRRDACWAATVIGAWAERYLRSGPTEDDMPALAESQVVTVEETREGKFTQMVTAGPHRFLADEPVGMGGDERGPDPYELLLAGLGACTAMTMRLYAEHKGIPLDRAVVHLEHEKVHAKDCAECETASGKVDRITRRVELRGDLTDEQRAGLLRIADRCPVHHTLTSENRIETVLWSDSDG